MAQTSIHIEPIKLSADVHNRRLKALDYVRTDLTPKNEHWQAIGYQGVADELAKIKASYKRAKGRSMHKRATPIREGVAVIDDTTTLADLQQFCQLCQDRWGIRPLSITTHKDEGHTDEEGKWRPNLHAHIIWRWCDDDGVTRKLGRADMAEMQTLLSQCLGMQRGQSSDVKHLNAVQYKVEQEEHRASEALEQTMEHWEALRDVGTELLIKQMQMEEEAEKKSTDDLLKQMGQIAHTIANYLTRQIGDLWHRYLDQWRRWYKGNVVTELDKIEVWCGGEVTDKQIGETYTADRSAGDLLVNGVSVPELERRQHQRQRASYPTDKFAKRYHLSEGQRIALWHYQPVSVDLTIQGKHYGWIQRRYNSNDCGAYAEDPSHIHDEVYNLAQDNADALSDALRQAGIADHTNYIMIKSREQTARQEAQRGYGQQEEQSRKRGRHM